MIKLFKFSIFIFIAFMFFSCTRYVVVKEVFNGGDEYPYAKFDGSKIYNIQESEAVAFYGGYNSTSIFKRPSTISEISFGYKETGLFFDQQEKPKPLIQVRKTSLPTDKVAFFLPGSLRSSSSLFIETNALKTKNIPITYFVDFINIGRTYVTNIIYIDCIPNNFNVTDVKIFHYGFLNFIFDITYSIISMGAWLSIFDYNSKFRSDNFDSIIWEIKEIEGLKYLILKIDMTKYPLEYSGKNIIEIAIEGNLSI